MNTYDIIEAGYVFQTRRAHSAESAIRAARRAVTIYASDYNCERGETVELEWTARPITGDGIPVTIKLKARAL